MKTIAEQIKWDFATDGELEIKGSNGKIYYEKSNGYWIKYENDSNGNCNYWKDSDGRWTKLEYDSNGNHIYTEHEDGHWTKCEYDSKGYRIYIEHSDGHWEKKEFDSEDNEIYYENSKGKIRDNRPKHCENKIVEIDGIKYKLTKV